MRAGPTPTPTAPPPSPTGPAARASDADRRKVREVAQEFESLLILQMVKQMRRTFLEEAEDAEGLGAETMTETLDVELARTLARQGGLGLATVIERGIERLMPPGGSGAVAVPGSPVGTSARPDFPASPRGAAGTRNSVSRPKEVRLSEPLPAGALAADREDDVVAAARIPSTRSDSTGPAPPAASDVTARDRAASPVDLSLPFDTVPTSRFGWRADPFRGLRRFHAGLDFRAAYGREVPAAATGRVVFAGEDGGYGLSVVVEHAGGVRTRYAHLSSVQVGVGQELAAAQVIGRVGQSGRATGPHLHFEVVLDGRRVDPARMAASVSGALKDPGTGVDYQAERVSAGASATGVDHED